MLTGYWGGYQKTWYKLVIVCLFITVAAGVIYGYVPSNLEVLTPSLEQVDLENDATESTQKAKTEEIMSTKPAQTITKHPQAEFIAEREALVKHAISAQNLENEDVIRVLGAVPRHQFVPEDLIDKAYFDTALPIGYGQTISQPSLVASMTELLALEPGDKVLEIGTGSGYQAAILAELGYVEVYSIEIVPELHERANQVLLELGYEEVKTKQADGYYGWPEFAPFDAIIVTAAPDHLPGPLAEQLAEGGVLVIPIGPQGWYQTLWKFVKVEGELIAYNQGPVSFVPFTGQGIEESTPVP